MALTLRNSFPRANGTLGCAPAPPTGVAANDLVFLVVITADDVIATVPGEFILVAEITGATRTRVYAKVSGGSEPTSYNVRWDSGAGTAFTCAVDSTTLLYAAPHQVAVASSEVASTDKIWNGVSNTDTDTLLLCFGGFGSNVVSTPDAAMIERVDAESPHAYLMTQAVAAAGATGTRTATGTSVVRQRCITISVTESNTYPVIYPPEVAVTSAPVLVELEGAGVHVTQAATLVELGAVGLYVTSAPVLIEFEYVEPPTTMPTYFPVSAGTRRMHRTLPDEVSGYAFDPEYSWWSSVVAEESSNLVVNPSFEQVVSDVETTEYLLDSLGFANLDYPEFGAVGATAGKRCARIEVANGSAWLDYIAGVAVTPGPYTFSCDVYATRVPMTIRLLVVDAAANVYGQRVFIAQRTGWQRLSVTYIEGGSGTRRMRLVAENPGAANAYLYTDAWQFEAKPYATTYLDGDMVGFSDNAPNQSYYWRGEPHRSVSTRRATTGSGGRVVSWTDEARFKTTSLVGLGMTTVEQRSQTLGDGREIHLGMLTRPREFTITGRIFGDNYRHLLFRHNDLIRLLKPNNTLGGDQMILRFQEVDDAEQLVGAPLDIICVYRDGMQGNITNFYQENLPLQFRAVQPFPMDIIESAAGLQPFKLLEDWTLIFRDERGEFFNLTDGPVTGGTVTHVGFLRDGSPIAFGNYTALGGDVVSFISYWNGSAWVQMGLPSSGTTAVDEGWRSGYPLAVSDVDGFVYEYNDVLNSWSVYDASFDSPIHDLVRDAEGNMWVGGSFITNNGNAQIYNLVAYFSATTQNWEHLGQGLAGSVGYGAQPQVNSVVWGDDGYIYFAGAIVTGTNLVGDITTFGVGAIRWSLAEQNWISMSGFNQPPNQIIKAKDGYIYAVGPFSKDNQDDYDLRGFARWNGSVWEEVFALVKVDGTYGADGLTQDENGIFWFYNFAVDGNDFFVVPGLGNVPSFGYRNHIYYPSPLYNTSLTHLAIGAGNRTIYVARSFEATGLYAAALNEIEYAGSADAPFALHLDGPGALNFVVNLDTEGGVYGRDTFVMNDEEQVVIRADTQRSMLYSNHRFNLQTHLAAGASTIRALRLRPGNNRISVLVPGTSGGSRLWLTWKNRFWGIEDARD